MIRALPFVVVGLVVLYVGWFAVLWLFQERVVFQPPTRVPATPVSARLVRYRSSDGVELFAYVVGDCASTDGTVVLAFHGNADLSRWFVPWATEVVRETSTCVVLPEYRGYDGLAGTPTYTGSAHDARAALEYVRSELGITPENTVYYGHSLGTAIAAELAASDPPRSLVLQSPFSSAREMAKRMVLPGLAAMWSVISRVHFDTLERVRTLRRPVWVSHGDRDRVVPVRMGREVFAAAAHKGELLIVTGAGHNDVADVGQRAYWDWLRAAVHAAPTFPPDPAARAETPPAP